METHVRDSRPDITPLPPTAHETIRIKRRDTSDHEEVEWGEPGGQLLLVLFSHVVRQNAESPHVACRRQHGVRTFGDFGSDRN